MAAFLLTLAILGTLIAVGIWISLYLYKKGALGRKRWRRVPGSNRYAFEAGMNEVGASSAFMSELGNPTAHYARAGIIIALGSLIVLATLIATFLNMLLH